jgi:hypothetical protein
MLFPLLLGGSCGGAGEGGRGELGGELLDVGSLRLLLCFLLPLFLGLLVSGQICRSLVESVSEMIRMIVKRYKKIGFEDPRWPLRSPSFRVQISKVSIAQTI